VRYPKDPSRDPYHRADEGEARKGRKSKQQKEERPKREHHHSTQRRWTIIRQAGRHRLPIPICNPNPNRRGMHVGKKINPYAHKITTIPDSWCS